MTLPQARERVLRKMSKGAKTKETEILDKELHTSKVRQEKPLQLLQTPAVPQVPHSERLKFAEYLGHAFQNLPISIYRDVQKSMFELMFNAEKQADMESRMSVPASFNIPPQQYQQWQPDPSQWPSRPVASARSVWHSQEPAWVDKQFPGYAQSPSQQELSRKMSLQTFTYTGMVPSVGRKQRQRSSGASGSQEDGSFSLSAYMMNSDPTADDVQATETTYTEFRVRLYSLSCVETVIFDCLLCLLSCVKRIASSYFFMLGIIIEKDLN
ncbi:hypothetical protein DPMN_017901 [Dreissena polymorpha]|uniref:Uncharacterized protein n=1 Tax=Dreissena polymorpha TaxID=45954 RepID=A0A9D4NFL0_DREPO|nr:hypothetical protein DPMN_017901 [Dreissena polymorpha]